MPFPWHAEISSRRPVSDETRLPSFELEDDDPRNCDDIFVDEDCPPSDDEPGPQTSYFWSLDGDASVEYATANAALSSSYVSCPPGFTKYRVVATLLPPGEAPLTIVSSGWWGIIYGELADPYGRYQWPGGFWPAIDGSGREAKIGTADAVCRVFARPGGFTINVSFFRYNEVEIRYPPTPGGGEGGGGGGGGGGCVDEWIIIEIDYGDGTGWHTWWEGMGHGVPLVHTS